MAEFGFSQIHMRNMVSMGVRSPVDCVLSPSAMHCPLVPLKRWWPMTQPPPSPLGVSVRPPVESVPAVQVVSSQAVSWEFWARPESHL